MNSYFNSYIDEKKFLEENYKKTIHYLEVNEVLDKYNWHFINPYIQVYKLNSILRQEKEGLLNQEKVNSFFIKEFYDLDITLSFIDGYFNRSSFIKPFNYHIESSLILFFQKDYAGAINIIIPVIEGVLSSYIEEYRGVDLKEGNRYEKIKKSIKQIKENILDNIKNNYDDVKYNKNQIKNLLNLHRKYYGNWVEIIDSFFSKSLFAHTSNKDLDNTLNRHSILHLLEIGKYDTIENYIKLFDSLKFLTWLFLQLEKKSIMNQIEDSTFLNKRLLYEDLIHKSKQITPIKNILLKDYTLSNKDLLQEITYKPINENLSLFGKAYLYVKKRILIHSKE